jgi:hypothetical protein
MRQSIIAILTSPDRIPPNALVVWYVDGFVASWESSHSCILNVLSPTLEMKHSQLYENCINSSLTFCKNEWVKALEWFDHMIVAAQRWALHVSPLSLPLLLIGSLAATRFALRIISPSRVCSRRRSIHKSKSSNSLRREDDNMLPLIAAWCDMGTQIQDPVHQKFWGWLEKSENSAAELRLSQISRRKVWLTRMQSEAEFAAENPAIGTGLRPLLYKKTKLWSFEVSNIHNLLNRLWMFETSKSMRSTCPIKNLRHQKVENVNYVIIC